MKKLLLIIIFPFVFQLNAQNTTLGISTGISDFYLFDYYKHSSLLLDPGFEVRLEIPLNKRGSFYSGIAVGQYRESLLHKSNDIKYKLNIRVWHISSPFYYKYTYSKNWHPRIGINLNIPLTNTNTYKIYDKNQLVYDNTDKFYKNINLDYFQLLLGVEVNIAKQWQLDFQTSFLFAAHASVGIKYLFPIKTKK